MKPITINKIHKLDLLLNEYIKEMELTDLTSTSYVITTMIQTLSQGNAIILVDDVDNPKMLIWGIVNSSAFLNKTTFHVAGIYIHKDKRGVKDNVILLMQCVEKAAKLKKCDVVFGASWYTSDVKEKASNMWLKSNYKKMETLYIKEI